MCVWACVCFVNSVSRRLRVPLFPLYLFICWGCWFPVQLFSIRANLFLSIYTTKHAHAHAFCGPPPHKLLSLIMGRSGVLRRTGTASSCDWERDILDAEASRVMAVQLAPDPQARWLTQVQLNRSRPAWMSPCSSHPGPQTDPLMGHQTKLPVWLARTEAMNAKCRCCSLLENS